MVSARTPIEEEAVSHVQTYRESTMIEDFEERHRSDSAYIWEISNITRWKKSAEIEVQERLLELEKASEIIFIFRLY